MVRYEVEITGRFCGLVDRVVVMIVLCCVLVQDPVLRLPFEKKYTSSL